MRLTALHESLIGEWTGKSNLWANGSESPAHTSSSRDDLAVQADHERLVEAR